MAVARRERRRVLMERTSDENYPDLGEQVTSVNGNEQGNRGTLNPCPRAWEMDRRRWTRARHMTRPLFLSNVRPGNVGIAIFPFLILRNDRIMRPFISSLLIGAVMAVEAAAATAAGEEFREELTLRPLPDGKVAAHFSFSTLLRGAVPRAPSSLGTDDTCKQLRGVHFLDGLAG